MLIQTIESMDIPKQNVELRENNSQPRSPTGHLSIADAAILSVAKKPIRRSYTASEVIKILVVTAKLETRRVTAIEKIFPDIISSTMMAMKQVRSAMRTGDRPTASVNVEFIV